MPILHPIRVRVRGGSRSTVRVRVSVSVGASVSASVSASGNAITSAGATAGVTASVSTSVRDSVSDGVSDSVSASVKLGLNRRSFDRRMLFGRTSTSRLFVQGVSRDGHVFLFWTCCLTVNKSLTSPKAPKKEESTSNRDRHQKR